MGEWVVGLEAVRTPPLVRVRQSFPGPHLPDPAAALAQAWSASGIALRPGARVALAIGSRGIHALPALVRALVTLVRQAGAEVVIIPAMGSHGGGTSEGQRAVLARLGVTAESVGAAIVSDLATVGVGALAWDGAQYVRVPEDHPGAVPVACARDLLEADVVVPLVRIKPHTGFRGAYESGICKMLAIGMGKHDGCSRLHREGYPRFPELLPAAARLVLARAPVTAAVAVLENAAETTAAVEVVPSGAIFTREPELLAQARALQPRLLLRSIDVLVVERVGKDISGVGMDPAITGRGELGVPADFTGPSIRRIVALALSPGAGGNASGLGMADLITEELFQSIDRATTATNVLTSGSLAGGRIPLAVPGADQAIRAALLCCPGVAPEQASVVRIRDTLHLHEIACSPAAAAQLADHPACQVLGAFDGTWSDHPGAAA